MWFDTILWLVAIVAFIMVEAAACLGLVCGGRCRGHAGQLF